MKIFSDLQNMANRGLSSLRGDIAPQAVARPASAASSQPAAPARLRGAWVPTMLDFADFKAAQAWRANEFFTLASFRVPEEAVYNLIGGRTFRAYFYARARKTAAFAGAGNQVLNCPGLIDTPQTANALPSRFHPEVRAFVRTAGGWAEADVVAINYATGDVTYTEPANCLELEIYYTHGDGEVAFEVSRNLGNSDYSGREIWNKGLGTLHQTDQVNGKTSHKWPENRLLVPGFRFNVNVKSALEIPFTPRAPHVLQVRSLAAQIEVLDKQRLGQLTEMDLREGV